MKKLMLVLSFMFVSMVAFAADAADLPASDFLLQLFSAIKDLGGMAWAGKVCAIVALLIGSTKVSFLRAALWDKLGAYKVLVAPLLGLAGGAVAYFSSGVQLTLANATAYIFAGAGAVLLSELLEVVKAIPGIGPMYLSAIGLLEGILGAKK